MSRRGRLSSEEIVCAAANSFYAHGYADTTLASVAEQLDVTDKAIYYYFKSKDQLYLQTLVLCTSRITEEINTIGATQCPGLDRIKSFIRAMIRQPENLRLYIRGLPSHLEDTDEGRRIRAAERSHDLTLIGWIDDGIADGSIRPGNPKMLWKWIQGGIIWLDVWSRREANGGPAGYEEEVMVVLDRFLGSTAYGEEEAHAERKHWVRNTLAVVQGLALLTAASSDSLAEFETTFHGRLTALARSRTRLLHDEWKTSELQGLIVDAVSALHKDRVRTHGPAVHVSSRTAMSLDLMLHELEMNSARHGALSRQHGRVDISWRHDEEGVVILTWQESGAPAPEPGNEELATEFISRLAQYELNGKAELRFQPDGLRTELRFAPN